MAITLGEKVKDLREELNLTQAKLGEILNMTQRKISYIERNRYEPSVDDIIQICKFFNITSDYLIGLDK